MLRRPSLLLGACRGLCLATGLTTGLATGLTTCLFGTAGAGTTDGSKAAALPIDSAFRLAYPFSAPSSPLPIAGVDLGRLTLPDLQLSARSEQAPEEGGVVLSFSDRAGSVRVLVQLAVLPDAAAARRVLDVELHGVSTQLSKALDPLLGDLAWADEGGHGSSLLLATQGNVAYAVHVLDGIAAVPTAHTIAGLLRTAMLPGAPQFPAVTVTLAPTIDAKRGGELQVSVLGGHPYKVRAEGGYIARGGKDLMVRPFAAGPVRVFATAVSDVGCVTVAEKITIAK